jgi:twinkle protein
LAEQAEQVARHLLPNGARQGREWEVGNVQGGKGKSCKVCLSGSKAGVWCDFSNGAKGDLLDLWRAVRGVSLAEALTEAKEFLGIAAVPTTRQEKAYRRPTRPMATKPQSGVMDYLHSRGLTEKSIAAYQVAELAIFGKQAGPWIVFPYKQRDELVSIKYLHINRDNGKKLIRAEADCEPILFGINTIASDQRRLVITEGEFDAMSLYEYGIPAVSVPFGGGTGAKHKWIDSCWDWLEQFSDIFLCMDTDTEGQAAAKDIAHRLGLHRCKVVILPQKDANECLMSAVKKEDLELCIENADTLDPEELKPTLSFVDDVIERFHPQGGAKPGIDLPWEKTMGRLRLFQGELSIWTGINGHGKSLLLGQVMMSATEQGQSCCIASLEMKPEKTLSRMVQQRCQQSEPNPDQIREVLNDLNGSVWIFDLVGTAKRNRLLEVFTYAFHRYGIRQFVIDSLSKCGIAEEDYKGQKDFIDQLGDFAKATGSHVHLVAHARKGNDEYSQPGKMDVKGTGALTDMADNVLSVHRNKAKERDLATLDNGGNVNGHSRPEIERQFDAFLPCCKHREDGADAEGCYGLFFNRQSLLYEEVANG